MRSRGNRSADDAGLVAKLALATYEGVPAAVEVDAGLPVARGAPCHAELLHVDLGMQQIAHRTIELARVGAVEHHREIAAVAPVRLGAELALHLLIKRRAGQGVGDADADFVRMSGLDQLA